jgi:NAD(P)-dependent dehydrogenase (short-subunit alcohol dehydrogenase family)
MHPQIAWIAGVGASAGLGAAIARRFASGGLTVAVTGRTESRLEIAANEIRSAGGLAHVLVGDISDAHSVQSLSEKVRSLGLLKAAVFNAGNATRANALELNPEDFEQAWRTSALGGFLFGKAALKGLLENEDEAQFGRGSLIYTSATAALRGRPPFAAFAAAKAGLRSITQSLAREFGPKGIHVANVVIDGNIDGERAHDAAHHRAERSTDHSLLQLEAIAETYWQLHIQHKSAWTQELDLRPFKESF